MGRKRGKELSLSLEERGELERIARARVEKRVRVERARYILNYADGESIYGIAKKYRTNRPKVQRVIHKALEYGALCALEDLPGRGRKPVIEEGAKLWILSIASQKPRELGLPQETWSMSLLTGYLREHCEGAGFACLGKLSKGTVSKILSQSNIKPHKVQYYMKRTDPEFERKMAQVLHVYKEVEVGREQGTKDMVVISYDEKPGVQAKGTVHEDVPPRVGGNAAVLRDPHYIRHGTISILNGIDLLTGHIHTIIRDRHRSQEFIEFLQLLDNTYPKGIKLKVILDNHSAHSSEKTKQFLKSRAGRFHFVFTPKHGSWLNIIEVFFSKLTRCLLKTIRVSSKQELIERVLCYIDELNRKPVVFKWKYKLNDI